MAAHVRAARPGEGGDLADAATLAIEHDHEHPDLPCAKQRLICDGTRVGLSEAVVARVVDQPAQRYAMAAVRGLVGILFERTLQDDLSIRRRSRSTGLRLS